MKEIILDDVSGPQRNHLKSLRTKTEVSQKEEILPQNCNTVSSLLAYPMDFGLASQFFKNKSLLPQSPHVCMAKLTFLSVTSDSAASPRPADNCWCLCLPIMFLKHTTAILPM